VSNYCFWTWFLKGSTQRPGIFNYIDRFLILHLAIAFGIYQSINTPLKDAACTMMLPLFGILFGITFAWSGNITALLSTEEIGQLSDKVNGGLEEYVYYTQGVVLFILTTSIGWGAAGLSIITERFWYIPLLSLTSLSVRECWNLILLAQYLTLARRDVSKATASKKNYPTK
jgi:hypothetical protein